MDSILSTAHWHAIICVSSAQKLQQNTICVECRNPPPPSSIHFPWFKNKYQDKFMIKSVDICQSIFNYVHFFQTLHSNFTCLKWNWWKWDLHCEKRFTCSNWICGMFQVTQQVNARGTSCFYRTKSMFSCINTDLIHTCSLESTLSSVLPHNLHV